MWKESSVGTYFVICARDKYAGYFHNFLHKSAKMCPTKKGFRVCFFKSLYKSKEQPIKYDSVCSLKQR